MVVEGTKDARFVAGDTVKFNNVKVRYAYLIDPDTQYRHQWSVECILEEDAAKILKGMGFNIKDSEDGPFIKLKKYTQTAAGKSMDAPRLVGRNPSIPFTENVGNGSICNVTAWCVYRTVQGEDHLCAYLNSVQVRTHVPYGGGADGFENLDADVEVGSEVPF